ncbi:MAG: choline-sulfatase [Candidatus Thioglobus sp.]|nr:MAG: choline-sulfatase [Candidatus Thioglobus sp.]
MTSKQPNILFIQADQLKPQVLPMYGGPAITPNLAQLADNGVTFENAYCNFPLCAPSRFSMLSGMLPSKIGAFDNGAEFPARIPTVAHYLRLAGYRTTLSGKQHFVGPDLLHGFEERLVPELYPTDFSWTPSWGEERMSSNNTATGVTRSGIVRRTVQIDHDEAVFYHAKNKLHQFAREDSAPFFLNASFIHPHEPYCTLQEYWDLYRHENIELPNTPLQPESEREFHTTRMLHHAMLVDTGISEEHVRIARHAYLGNVSYFDEMVGGLMKTLEQTGLLANTVVVISADHGDMLGEHGLWYKKHFFEDCIRVPLIIHWPERFSAGRHSQPASLIDLLPTLCDLAEIVPDEVAPEPLDGSSLLGACEGQMRDEDTPVFAEITSEGVPSPMFMVRKGKHKLMSGGGAPSVLYDLERDPHELINLAHDATHHEILDELEGLVRRQWDSERLNEQVLVSQRQRRLVHAAHEVGKTPAWEHQSEDLADYWIHRDSEGYNDWAWKGISEV